MPSDLNLAVEFRAALRPLFRRFVTERSISLGKSGILNRLNEHGAATASELAAAEQITPQAVAVALRELEEMALVSRVRDEADRRRVHVELTEQGRIVLLSEREAGTRWLADALMDRLDDSDRAVLASAVPVLRKLVRNADDARGGDDE